MRAVIQRVSEAKVNVSNQTVGEISNGLLVLLGVNQTDTLEQIPWLVDKIVNLRVFSDGDGKMNLSLLDINGEILIVSQFTLYGDCKKGRRPSYSNAARPEKAEEIYEEFIEAIKMKAIKVATGEFGAHMQVELINDGPVTLIIDSN